MLFESNIFSGFAPAWCLYRVPPCPFLVSFSSPACSSWMWFQSCLYFLVGMLLVILEVEVLANTHCLLFSLQTQMMEVWMIVLLLWQPWHTQLTALCSQLGMDDQGVLEAYFPVTSPRSEGFLCKVIIMTNCSAVTILP